MSNLEEKFVKFHAENPHIYNLFCKYAQEAIDSGKTRISHWLIINRIRWDSEVLTETEDKFKISNDYIALYARKFIKDNPHMEGFFQLKEMKNA